MATNADYQAEIQATAGAYLMGDTSSTTGSRIMSSGIEKMTTLRGGAVPRGTSPGVAASLERIDRTVITVPVEFYSTTAALLEAELQLARAAWATMAGDDGNELRLDIREPGTPETVMAYFGRARPLVLDRTGYRWGRSTGRATFLGTDPLAYGAAVTPGNDASSPASWTNDGDHATRRATITINGDGGTPVVTNTSDGNGDLTFTDVLAIGDDYVVDLYAETVVDAGALNMMTSLSPSSTWFELQPGANSVTFTGCGSVDITLRPAWAPGG